MVKKLGIWMKIVTLVVPGWNSSDEELREAAGLLAQDSSEILWQPDRVPQALQDDGI